MKTSARALAPFLLATLCGSFGLAVGCNGTGSGDTGDHTKKLAPSELGHGDKVADVVEPATWFDGSAQYPPSCAYPITSNVALTGQVIVGVDRYDETGNGSAGTVYFEDVPEVGADPVPFSGLEVFNAAFSPPDLRVFEGDVVDTLGSFEEFPGPSGANKQFQNCATLPEATGTLSFRFENGYRPPAILVPDGSDSTNWASVKGYTNARQWMGMLVKFQNVTLTSGPVSDGKGRLTVSMNMGAGTSKADQITIDNEFFDLGTQATSLTTGTTIKSVTGVFTYFYNFHLSPRSAEDIEL